MKLVAIAKKKEMLAFDFSGKGEKVWTNCSKAVLEFVKKNFKEGDDVTPTFAEEEKDGMKYVTLVKKGGQSAPKKEASNSGKPTCEDCGKGLKDDKYKKCFECNKKKPTPTETASSKATSIEKQNVNNAVSRTLIGLQGQIDINNVLGVIDTLWEKYYSKLK